MNFPLLPRTSIATAIGETEGTEDGASLGKFEVDRNRVGSSLNSFGIDGTTLGWPLGKLDGNWLGKADGTSDVVGMSDCAEDEAFVK